MLESLIYVSKSRLEDPEADYQIAKIAEIARSRNASLGVTGALVFTEARFAQILEGPRSSLDELMLSISRDQRHQDVDVLCVETVQARSFSEWSLAYSGPSLYVDRHIKPLLGDLVAQEQNAAYTQRLLQLMQGLSTGELPAQ